MDEFAFDILTPLVDIPRSGETVFKPWHKPRKQWCRNYQWLSGLNWAIDRRITTPRETDNAVFNYLGLPGDDLLDLRLFAYGCKRKHVKLKYLGFITASSDELRLSESQLHKTGNISSDSKVITEPLESLARKDSRAFMEARSYNGFHMINFDLCNSIAKTHDSEDTYLNALANLLEMQMNCMKESWTLFVTTYACKQSIVEEIMKKLLKVIKNNNEHHLFSAKLQDELFIEASKVENAIRDLESLNDQEFFDLFALGFSKWLLKICKSVSSTWNILMTPSCKYRTGDCDTQAEPNMLSLAFSFEYVYQHANDPFEISILTSENIDISELTLALDMVTRVGEIFNLDSKIAKCQQLEKDLLHHSTDLLANANYDRNEYAAWVDQGCPSS